MGQAMGEKYKKESGIPIPGKIGPTAKYNFREMAVGDSFSFPMAEYTRVARAAGKFAYNNGYKFTLRTMGDGTGRVWRIS